MKLYRLFLVLAASVMLYSFKTDDIKTLKCSYNLVAGDSIPTLNKEIIAFVDAHIGKTVARGECWDLAAEPLNALGATWDKMYVYGKKVNYRNDSIYPGDIIQFEGVEVESTYANMTVRQIMDHHTAIIYKVKGVGEYVLAHQNASGFGRKVGLSNLTVKDITTGHFTIFQPYK